MSRFLELLRGVLPEDRAQLLVLFGIVCLFISPQLRWSPWAVVAIGRLIGPQAFILVSMMAVYFSAAAGFFICFRPGRHPSRRLVWWVCLPAVFGNVVFCSTYFVNSSYSGLSTLGPGFHYALIGITLVALFTFRVAVGFGSLPLALPESSVLGEHELVSWPRVEIFLWLLLAAVPAVHSMFPFMNVIYVLVYSYSHAGAFKQIVAWSAEVFAENLFFILVAVWVMGSGVWGLVRRSLRCPAAWSIAPAIAFPVGIYALISAGQFMFGVLRWAAHRPIRSYFGLPSIALLSLLLIALAEEVIFRGVLQPQFVRRYGPIRGIFLVGVAFAAVHLSSDFSTGFTDGLVIVKLCLRLVESLALSFVFGWLTVRTGSVIPAAVAHGLFNVLGLSASGPNFPGVGPVYDLSWAVLAYALFQYCPLQDQACENGAKSRRNLLDRASL